MKKREAKKIENCESGSNKSISICWCMHWYFKLDQKSSSTYLRDYHSRSNCMHICRRQDLCSCNACMWAFLWSAQVELAGKREARCRHEAAAFSRKPLAECSDEAVPVELKLVARRYWAWSSHVAALSVPVTGWADMRCDCKADCKLLAFRGWKTSTYQWWKWLRPLGKLIRFSMADL